MDDIEDAAFMKIPTIVQYLDKADSETEQRSSDSADLLAGTLTFTIDGRAVQKSHSPGTHGTDSLQSSNHRALGSLLWI